MVCLYMTIFILVANKYLIGRRFIFQRYLSPDKGKLIKLQIMWFGLFNLLYNSYNNIPCYREVHNQSIS